MLQSKMMALSFDDGQVKVRVDNEPFEVRALELLQPQSSAAQPGQCVERTEEHMTIQAANGLVRLQIPPLSTEI